MLCDPIGVGGSGTVWRAFDREREQFCAAKLLRQRDAGELLRFAREQSVRVKHPRVVSPYAWAADDGMVVIVSELIDGGSLHTLLGDYGPLAEGTIVAAIDQVLDALGAVHDAQLIHRDVKPGNLLLRSGSGGPLQLLLTDFGLTIGVRDARLTEYGTVIGTPGYLPPEVLAGGVSPDTRHDLYAVGKLALTMHAGSEVADPATYLDLIDDPVLRSTIEAMISADPALRPADTAAARAMLAGAIRDDLARTGDGDQIVVLRQLPPLPDGWAPHGIEIPRTPSQPSTQVDEVITEVVPAAADPGAPAALTVPPALVSIDPQPAASVVEVRSRTPRLLRFGGLAAAVIAVMAVVIGNLGSDPTTPDNQQPGIPVTGATTPGGGADTNGSVAVVIGSAAAGQSCGNWQQEGNTSATPEGIALRCAIVDGAYVWTVAG